ncbi:ribosome biogenesis GTPase Der [Enterobacteriaceae endosymbiont of Donacia cincticornis]|uniref:ribosome biogenesis GTPase Der n=1 Tax=Enterobacteriaceae endosymbiont of Donacia cincticornis TaxID=2675773 RepID=UPI0014494214|nr:ribosome biogenesis GTPase Der [Enterobacteriaceae endosymbiont of Donacia cincticornis]QJC35945.1 ribosome biogenesis GTPase Der [Enterobacteriaceae endosymbiont of Donacia cincticornis]
MITYQYPIITILGDNNVGKSSLYNILIKKYDSLVNKIPNFTIDKKYGKANIKNIQYICVDTISYNKIQENNFLLKKEIVSLIKESNLILLLIRGNKLNILDYLIIDYIRKYNKKVIIILNTTKKIFLDNEFYSLGFEFYQINIKNYNNIIKLKKILYKHIKKISDNDQNNTNFLYKKIYVKNKNNIKIAIIGMPNVGKSTLVNKFINEKRMIVNDTPGTTRESIYIPLNIFNSLKKNIVLIDTAGIKKKTKIKNKVEKFSILESYKTIYKSDIVLYIINGEKKFFCKKDIQLIRYIISKKKNMIFIINKADLLTKKNISFLKKEIKIKFNFFPVIAISAKFILNLNSILKLVCKIYNMSIKKYRTSQLMKILNLATNLVLPPLYNGKRIKLKYIHQVQNNPLLFKIYGNQLKKLNLNYKRYLLKFIYNKLQCFGNIINIKFQENKNPYN